jgi:Holliday junction resolvase RusA-like endonuclease
LSEPVSFWVPGKPAPKGSHRAFVHNGRAIVTDDTPATKQWQKAVSVAARYAMREAGVEEFSQGVPVYVVATFAMPRPNSHYRTGKSAHELAADAPAVPTGRTGDADKLLRSTLDGLTGIVFFDDAQVVAAETRKVYAPLGQPIGVAITVREASASEIHAVTQGYLEQVWHEQPNLRAPHETKPHQTEIELGN